MFKDMVDEALDPFRQQLGKFYPLTRLFLFLFVSNFRLIVILLMLYGI